jgi:hypothetical protein
MEFFLSQGGLKLWKGDMWSAGRGCQLNPTILMLLKLPSFSKAVPLIIRYSRAQQRVYAELTL